MKNVSIIVDSGSDLLKEEADKLGVILMPLNVRFNDEQFLDGVNLSRDEFYDRLVAAETLPKTSLISPALYSEVFEQETSKGNEVVCLVISSGVSGCYQSALIASQDYEGVYVVDSRQFCAPLYLLTIRANQLREQGLSAKEIADTIEKEKECPKVCALFDTLEYLKLGGRISSAAAAVGELISIKPILTIKDGVVEVLAKARGMKNGYHKLTQIIEESGQIDWSKPVILSYTGKSDERMVNFITTNNELFAGHESDYIVSRVGATIGTYAGPDAFAISYYPISK